MEKDRTYFEVDLMTLLKALWRRVGVILLASVLAGVLGFSAARFLITPQYQASAMMYVNNTRDASATITNSELSAAQSLVDTYVVILNSRATLAQIRAAANLTCSNEELAKMISATALNSTEVFQVTVTSPDPQEAADIANTITRILPERISSVVEGSSVRVVDSAAVPSKSASPNVRLYAAVGLALGFFVSCAVIILRELFDHLIRSEDYLMQVYPSVPVLAVIPELLRAQGEPGEGYGAENESGKRGKADAKSK